MPANTVYTIWYKQVLKHSLRPPSKYTFYWEIKQRIAGEKKTLLSGHIAKKVGTFFNKTSQKKLLESLLSRK